MKTFKILFALILLLTSTNAALALIAPVPSACVDLTSDLYVGLYDQLGGDGQVQKLQTFLSPQYFTENPTGFFGVFTKDAVTKFQTEHGIVPAAGFVGPVTRGKIKELTCGNLKVFETVSGEISKSTTSVVEPVVTKSSDTSTNNAETTKIISDTNTGTKDDVLAPVILSLTPSSGVVGTNVVIRGEGINVEQNRIYFKGNLVSKSGLSFQVPAYISSSICPRTLCLQSRKVKVTPGVYDVVVVNDNGRSNALNFTVIGASTDGTANIGFDANYTKTKTVSLPAGQTTEPRFYLTSANIPSATTACYLQRKINGNWEVNGMAFYTNRSITETTYSPTSPVGVGTHEYRYKCGTIVSDTATFTVTNTATGGGTANIGFDANYTKTKNVQLAAGQTTFTPTFYLTSANIPTTGTTQPVCYFQKKTNGNWDVGVPYYGNQTVSGSVTYSTTPSVGVGTHEYRYKCGTIVSDIAILTVTNSATGGGTANIGFDSNYTKTKTMALSTGQSTVMPTFYLTSANIPATTPATICYLQKKTNGNWDTGMAFYTNRSEAGVVYEVAPSVGVGTHEYRYKCGGVTSSIATLTVTAATTGGGTTDIGFDANYTKTKNVQLAAGQMTVVPFLYLTSINIPASTMCNLQKKNGSVWDINIGNSSYGPNNGAFPYIATNIPQVGIGTHKYRYVCGTVISAEATLTVSSM